MKKSRMSAIILQRALGTSIVLLIILSGVGFYFAQEWLHTLATSVSQTVAQSKTRDSGLQSLNKLQKELEAQQEITTKTNNIAASNTAYQTQSVQDLIAYAGATGITISDYAFPLAAATPAATTVPATQVTVKLTSPISYSSLLKFMTAIEGNLPKMQITSVNLGRIVGDNSSVKIDQLTIAVYTR
ncbi:hypothetical protein BH10PAT4_BH10PAT4_3350 [soil metagenome]